MISMLVFVCSVSRIVRNVLRPSASASGRDGEASADSVTATANFQVNTFKHEEKRTDFFFGHYRYRLVRDGERLGIREKYIVVCNDIIPRQMDIFNI